MKTPTFILLFVLEGLQATPSVLINPDNLSLPANLKETELIQISTQEQKAWLNKVYDRVSMHFNFDRKTIKDHEGLSLDEWIKKASQAYLELNLPSALENVQQASDLLITSLPYRGLRTDMIELIALDVLARDGVTKSSHFDPFILQNDVDFLDRLPQRIRNEIELAHRPSVTLQPSAISEEVLRLSLMGEEKKLPTKIRAGKYLAHIVTVSGLTAAWLGVDSKGAVEIQNIWTRPLWQMIDAHQASALLTQTKPKAIVSTQAIVVFKNASDETTFEKFPLKQGSSWRHPLNIHQPVSGIEMVRRSPFEAPDLTADLDEKESSVFRSPWFWAITAAVAGATGYLVYDATQTRTLKTP